MRVNSNAVHDGTDQFFQWLSVDAVTGAANVIFYDRRGDEDNRKTTVTLARSTDGGSTFTNYAWTREPFVSTRDEFIGDYTGIAALNNKVYGVWTEVVPRKFRRDKNASPQPLPAAYGGEGGRGGVWEREIGKAHLQVRHHEHFVFLSEVAFRPTRILSPAEAGFGS